jgi:hypothetical protein
VRNAIIVLIVLILGFSIWHIEDHKSTSVKSAAVSKTASIVATKSKAVPTPSVCVGNTIPQEIVVSINKQHMWVCGGATQAYDSPVITGMENLAADLTPVGTYKIYAKETDVYLKGSDSSGSWDDFVNYWMPFLYNQYGTYGFHDATWRASTAFGNTSPESDQGSHGCVEMPLTTAAWLYNWAQIGATVVIQA